MWCLVWGLESECVFLENRHENLEIAWARKELTIVYSNKCLRKFCTDETYNSPTCFASKHSLFKLSAFRHFFNPIGWLLVFSASANFLSFFHVYWKLPKCRRFQNISIKLDFGKLWSPILCVSSRITIQKTQISLWVVEILYKQTRRACNSDWIKIQFWIELWGKGTASSQFNLIDRHGQFARRDSLLQKLNLHAHMQAPQIAFFEVAHKESQLISLKSARYST